MPALSHHPTTLPSEHLSSIEVPALLPEPPDPPALIIAHRLRTARHLAQLTQQQLAGERYSRRFISELERGEAPPSLEALQTLARWLGLPVSYFVAAPVGGVSRLAERPRVRRVNCTREQPVCQNALLRMLGEAEVLLRQRAADAALQVLGSAAPQEALSRLHHPRWYWLRGWAFGVKRNVPEAMACSQQGLAVAEALQEHIPFPYRGALVEMAIRLRSYLGHFAAECGQPQQALAYVQPCLAAVLDGLVKNVDLELGVYEILGEAACLVGQLPGAISYFESGIRRLEGLHRPLVQPRLLWGLARAHWRAGDMLLAKRYAQQVLALELGDRRILAAQVHTLLGRALLRLGEQREAEWHLRQGLGGALRSGDPLTLGTAYGSYAEFFLAKKAYEQARALVWHGLETRAQLAPQAEGHLLLMLAQVYQGTHDPAGDRTFQEAIACFERTSDLFLRSWAHEAYGSFQAEQGRFAEAYQHQRLATLSEPRLNLAGLD